MDQMTDFITVDGWYAMGRDYVATPPQVGESIREYWIRELVLCGEAVKKIQVAIAESKTHPYVEATYSKQRYLWCDEQFGPDNYITQCGFWYFNRDEDAIMFKLIHG